MKTLTLPKDASVPMCEVFYADNVLVYEDGEVCEPEDLARNHFIDAWLDYLDDSGREAVLVYAALLKKPVAAMLVAHGGTANGVWTYEDSGDSLVSDWVSQNDGKYALLILSVCNPGHHTPIASRSLMLLSDDTFSAIGASSGESNFTLVHPQDGDMEYTAEYWTGRWKEDLAMNK